MSELGGRKSGNLALRLLIPVCIGCVVCLVLMMLCALLMTFQDISPSMIKPLASVCGGIGAFAGGFAAARKIGRRGLLLGLAVGGLIFLLVTIAGFFVGPVSVSIFTVLKLVVMLLSGAIGGVAGINLGRKRRLRI